MREEVTRLADGADNIDRTQLAATRADGDNLVVRL